MNAQRIFLDEGISFTQIIEELLEGELVKQTIQKYNSGKDIAAIEKEEE